MDQLTSQLGYQSADWYLYLMSWTDPFWWITTAVLIFLIFVLGVWPLSTHPTHTQFEAVAIVLRKITLISFILVVLIFPLLMLAIHVGYSTSRGLAADQFILWYWDMFLSYWPMLLSAPLLGWTIKVVVSRYFATYWSSLIRRFRVVQSGDMQSDIRREIGKYEPIDFEPSKYYKAGRVFMGIDDQGKPLYVPLDLYYETHIQIVGPTRSGKGVLLGVILDQAIRRGDCVFYIDPKTDKFLPHIMKQAAETAGRPFIYLDLNAEGRGKWAPFQGGELRDRRARMINTFGLQSRGTDADVYLARERGVVDRLIKHTNGGLSAMVNYVREHDLDELASRLSDGLREWNEVQTFTPAKNRGFSIRRSLLENAVVYVRGSVKDHVIRDATRSFIIELVQEISALGEKRNDHLTVAVDEVRFVISEPLVDALATVAGFGVNIITAYQSILDIRNLPDKTIDRQATEQSVNVNSQIKVLYRAPDFDTAEWGAKQSGTQFKTVPRFESTNIGKYGEETWGDNRMLTSVEENLITENLLLGLKSRVAVVYQPGELASVCRTSWVPVTKEYKQNLVTNNNQTETTKPSPQKPTSAVKKKPAKVKKEASTKDKKSINNISLDEL